MAGIDQEDDAGVGGDSASVARPLWRNRDYLLLWIGDAISSLGSQASQLALPLLILAVTGSPARAGLLSAIRGAAYLLIGLPAGALIDRLDRRAVLVVTDSVRALALGSIPLALLAGRLTMGQLYAVACLEALGFIAYGLAHTASLPRVVPRAQLPVALAQAQFLDSFARTAGPLLGGALFAAARSLPFALDALSYTLSVAMMLALRTPLVADPAARTARLGGAIAGGLAWLRGQRTLFALTLLNGAVNFIYGGYVLLVIALAQRLGAGAAAIGLVFTLGGIGTLLGAALVPGLLRRFTTGHTIVVCLWLFVVVWVAYLLAPAPVALGAVLAVAMATVAIYSGATLAYRLVATPDALQARVAGFARLLTYGAQAGAYLLMGILLQRFGAVATVWITLVPSALLALLATLNRPTRRAPLLAAVEVTI